MGQAVTDRHHRNRHPATVRRHQNTSNNDRKTKKNYLAMREFWVGYSGLTPYPGEILKSVASACAMTTANGATPTSKR
jgi:hypothetical protein